MHSSSVGSVGIGHCFWEGHNTERTRFPSPFFAAGRKRQEFDVIPRLGAVVVARLPQMPEDDNRECKNCTWKADKLMTVGAWL